ncbi:2412_t:CDS:2 [Acaulospora colombiana]|uniref:2412_t:CDS:1 n=1 Tax=Acaulospora colombiana TaxID=27376 RepID=A0ACA9LF87_9GLOM|nr:2412_t:CDS:2 [Acaulospora colombiana]
MSTNSSSALTTNQYKGPNAEVAKLFLASRPNLEYLEYLLTNFITSRSKTEQRYTLNSGLSLFFMFQQIAYLKLSSNETGRKEKIEWVRIFVKVFSTQGFLGFVGLRELIAEVEGAFLQSLDSTSKLLGWDRMGKNIVQDEDVLESPRLFHDGKFVNLITRDIQNDPGLRWKTDSQSYKELQAKNGDLLFRELPKVARGISSLALVSDKNTTLNLFTLIHSFSGKLFAAWEECPLSLIEKEESLDDKTRAATPLLWATFKPLIFFVTLIFKSIVDQSLFRPEICEQEVFFSVLDRSLDDELESKLLVNTCRPPEGSTPTKRSRITYYLLIIEQLMRALDDDTLENYVLPFIHPYTIDNTDSQLFESAHSVILSIFSNLKRVSNELAPYYCSMLLEGYPTLFTITQLRAAYTTVIKSLSDIDDASVWSCLEKLIGKIEVSQNSDSSTSSSLLENNHKDETMSSESSDGKQGNLTSGEKDDSKDATKKGDDAWTDGDPNDEYKNIIEAALYLRRGYLLLTLIDQVQNVNLIFLEKLLKKIKEFLQAEPDGVGKLALKKVLFDALSTGLDYTKRDVGVRWWLSECDLL